MADRKLHVAVIGAGMAGILAAIRLEQAGIGTTIFEKADRVGGTWRENTYPGLSCDVPAHSYTYSFARNPDWSHWYAPGPEIQDYFQHVADEHGVTPRVRFGDEVTSLEWRDGCWTVETARGYTEQADAVIAATGVLHHPNIPSFAGLDTFTGAWFHTARWNHDVPLDGRRVGVVGTGSTAVQLTSALVDRVARYVLFQRTAQWVYPGPNPAYTEEDKARFRADPAAFEEFIRWLGASMIDSISNAVIDVDSPQLARIEQGCRENLATVRDPVLRERLTPPYRAACKRLVFSPDFYEAMQRPNVSLVTAGIDRIEPAGVRTLDGALHELDVLVLATGFRADRFVRPVRVIGRDGADLDEAWASGPSAYLSISVPAFPNFFMLNGPNGPVGNFSLIEVAERQLAYIEQLLGLLRSGACREINASATALDTFERERREAAHHTVWMTGCQSWYLDAQGVPASWTFTYQRFLDEMAGPRLADFDLR